jgi:hypothetical protein
MGIDVDDQPVPELLRRGRGLGEIIARIGARGNLLELLDPRRCFADIHFCTLLSTRHYEPYGGLHRFGLLPLTLLGWL